MISVIVPVYNVENYLDECIQSILNQSFNDFEIILVDDGSTDSSGKLCDYYAKQDSRITVIHKSNKGLSDARNKGTETAKGTHVTYIDSDDYISSDYLDTLWKLVKQYDSDIAVTGIKRFSDGKTPETSASKIEDASFTGKEALKKMLYQKGMDTSACAMLIKASIAKKHLFPLGKFHEDDFTSYKYYLDAKTVSVSYKYQYFYRQRRGSIMHTFGQACLDELDAADNLVFEMAAIDNELKKAAEAKKFSDYCQVCLNTKNLKRDNRETYNRISRYLKASRRQLARDSEARWKNRVAAVLLCIGGIPLLTLANRIIAS